MSLFSDLGGKRLMSDAAVFTFPEIGVMILVDVDDVLVVGPDAQVAELLQRLGERLKMKIDEPMVKEGDQALMLGRRVRRTAWGYRLSGGDKLVQKMARELSLEVAAGREVKTPAAAGQVQGSIA